MLKAADHPLAFAKQEEERTIVPDLVVVRNFPRSLHQHDYRNVVLALHAAGFVFAIKLFF